MADHATDGAAARSGLAAIAELRRQRAARRDTLRSSLRETHRALREGRNDRPSNLTEEHAAAPKLAALPETLSEAVATAADGADAAFDDSRPTEPACSSDAPLAQATSELAEADNAPSESPVLEPADVLPVATTAAEPPLELASFPDPVEPELVVATTPIPAPGAADALAETAAAGGAAIPVDQESLECDADPAAEEADEAAEGRSMFATLLGRTAASDEASDADRSLPPMIAMPVNAMPVNAIPEMALAQASAAQVEPPVSAVPAMATPAEAEAAPVQAEPAEPPPAPPSGAVIIGPAAFSAGIETVTEVASIAAFETAPLQQEVAQPWTATLSIATLDHPTRVDGPGGYGERSRPVPVDSLPQAAAEEAFMPSPALAESAAEPDDAAPAPAVPAAIEATETEAHADAEPIAATFAESATAPEPAAAGLSDAVPEALPHAPDVEPAAPEPATAEETAPAVAEPIAAASAARAQLDIAPRLGPGMRIRLAQIGYGSLDDLADADPERVKHALGPISRLLDVERWIAYARLRRATQRVDG